MKNGFKAVEMAIFAIVSLIFLNSAYSLFMDGRFGSDPAKPSLAAKGEPTPNLQKDYRSEPNSTLSSFIPYETKCQATGEVFETTAAKVRILGPLCGAVGRQLASDSPSGRTENILTDYRIENITSRYVATVFSDSTNGKFSTDFIPLESGTNKILMEFRYKGGKVFPVELKIIKK